MVRVIMMGSTIMMNVVPGIDLRALVCAGQARMYSPLGRIGLGATARGLSKIYHNCTRARQDLPQMYEG